jgi:hypothetical protein
MTMPWRRTLAAALALATVAGGVLVAGAAQAAPVGTTGSLTIIGDSHDAVTMGKSYSYTTGKGVGLSVSSDDSGATVNIELQTAVPPIWVLHFDAPGTPDQPVPGRSPILVPGTYTGVREFPGNGTSPGLSVEGGWGCAKVTGSFTIKKAVFGPLGYVQSFDATFVQHCEGVAAAARGEVRISNPPPSPRPAPPPSPTRASPYATPSTYAVPSFEPTATDTGGGAVLAGGAGTSPTSTGMTDADRARLLAIGLVLIAVVILLVNAIIGVRLRRLRQASLSSEPSPARPATVGGVVLGPWPTDDPPQHPWLRHDPSPPVARRSLPGKVIAVSAVLAGRGALGVLATAFAFAALQLHPVQAVLPSWYANVLWGQLAICVGQIVSGLLLLRGKAWPRMLGLSVLWYDIAGGALIMVSTTLSCTGLFPIVIDAVLIWMLFWAEVRDWCY